MQETAVAEAPAKQAVRGKKRETREEERRRRVKTTTVGRFKERLMRIVETLDEFDPGKEMEQIVDMHGRIHALGGYIDDIYYYLSVEWDEEAELEGGTL